MAANKEQKKTTASEEGKKKKKWLTPESEGMVTSLSQEPPQLLEQTLPDLGDLGAEIKFNSWRQTGEGK